MKISFNDVLLRAQPDPFMCKVQDGWVMYVTGIEGVHAYYCDNPFGRWEYKGIVCKKEHYHQFWAPCMYYEDNWYYLYVSCREVGTDDAHEYLYVSKAPTPYGPFDELICLRDCFSIDPHVVRTDAGLFLWYCMDRVDTDRVGTRIFVHKMADPMTLTGVPVEMVKPTFDEEIYMRDRFQHGQHWHTIEGPFWLEVDGWQYVMYSGACYQNDTYHIGYAAAKNTEPDLTKVSYEKHTDGGGFAPLMIKNDVEEGIGHHSVICYEGQYYAVYHARDYTPDPRLLTDQRTARICKLFFNKGVISAELL